MLIYRYGPAKLLGFSRNGQCDLPTVLVRSKTHWPSKLNFSIIVATSSTGILPVSTPSQGKTFDAFVFCNWQHLPVTCPSATQWPMRSGVRLFWRRCPVKQFMFPSQLLDNFYISIHETLVTLLSKRKEERISSRWL